MIFRHNAKPLALDAGDELLLIVGGTGRNHGHAVRAKMSKCRL